MATWNLSLCATLDLAPAERGLLQLGRRIAGKNIAMVTGRDNRFGVTATVEADDPRSALDMLAAEFVHVLAEAGYTLTHWESLEVLSSEETERRVTASSMPPMVSTVDLAKMCGVSKQRVYELEHERRKAAEAGRPHSFPTPVVPGWWLKSSAERYAATRKRKPGPARRGD